MNHRKIVILIMILFFCGNAQAQYASAKTDDWLAANAPEMGGRAVLMVWQNGKIVYAHAENNLTRRQRMIDAIVAQRSGKTADNSDFTPSKRLAIASCSKWLSAALIMTFVDEGKIKLTDTVGKYLPVLSSHDKGNITISDCLSHLTGIQSPSIMENIQEMKDVNSMDEAIERIAGMPMEGEPGKVFRYSSTGLQIAGAILEKISGKSFETLFAERIAAPLDMKNTDFGKDKVVSPAGGAYSTPEDYLNFLVMILNKGVFNNKRILSEKSVAQMQVNRIEPGVQIGYKPKEAGSFGYGYGEWTMGDSSVTSPGLFGSFPWINNDKKYAAFLMTFYLKSEGRNERYLGLKSLVDGAVAGK